MSMWKAIFQNKLTIYKANLPSFVQKNMKSRCYVDLSRRQTAEKPHKNGGVWKANLTSNLTIVYITTIMEFVGTWHLRLC
jgi:hypothetical protein